MNTEESVEISIDKLRRRFVRGFLDLLILQLVETEPTWGYDIIKKTEATYKIRLRHGALYPMLNMLKTEGLLESRNELHKGRVRKVYQITKEGRQLLQAYHNLLKEMTPGAPSI